MSRPYYFINKDGGLLVSFDGVNQSMLPTHKVQFLATNYGDHPSSDYTHLDTSDAKRMELMRGTETPTFENLPPVAAGVKKGGSWGTAAKIYPFQNQATSVNSNGSGAGIRKLRRPTFKEEADLIKLARKLIRK